MLKLLSLWVVVWVMALPSAGAKTQAERYSDGEEPKLSEPLPAAYRDYQILPGSLSPNHRYALLYPKRAVIYTLDDNPSLFLVAFRPFRMLAPLPLGYSNLCENARNDYYCTWAKDSSAVVFMAGMRWGAEKVSAVSVRDGQIVHHSELTAPIQQLLQADFKRAGLTPYNNFYDFIFSESIGDGDHGVELTHQESWQFDKKGRVLVDCLCTNDPKPGGIKWEVHFKGAWDLAREAFVEHTFTRVP